MKQKFGALLRMKSSIFKSKKQTEFEFTEFDELSLLGLPDELIRKVIRNLEVKDWLTLCLTCKYLHNFVEKSFLYQNVKIRSREKLVQFKKSISKNKKTNPRSLYVSRIEFIHPEKDQANQEASIAGYAYLSQNIYTPESYISILLQVISYLPNLQEINLRHISSGFQFPEWTSSLKTYAHEHNYYPSIRKLRLSSEEGWTIPLRPNLLWPFGIIEELMLYDMIIDSNSLKKPPHLLTLSNERGPLITKEALKSQSSERWSPIKELSLKQCTFAANASRNLENYFKEVEKLKLLSLKSHYDLLLSHCFPNLKELQIDLNSKCFSLYNPSEAHSINIMNNNSNYSYFNSKFVPNFYMNYRNFTEVLGKLPKDIEKITLVNVSFTNITPVDPQSENDEDNNLPNNNLFRFLNLLRDFSNIEFQMLKSYKLHQQRNKRDWEELLSPCFTPRNSVRVKDKDGSVLFSRNERY